MKLSCLGRGASFFEQTSPFDRYISDLKFWTSLAGSPLVPGTIALVTGGSRGLGLELVFQLIRYKVKIIVIDIVPPTAEFLETDQVVYYCCDITEYEAVKALQKKIKREHGVVTMLFNNAGITRIETLQSTSDNDIRNVIDVNYIAAYIMINIFLPDILEIGHGYIVNIASVLGEITPARLTSYGASKGGLIAVHNSLTKNLCRISNPKGAIKTLLVCPGKINTSMFAKVRTPSRILAPDIEPDQLASHIIEAINRNMTTILRFPYYANIVPFFKQLNWPYLQALKTTSGMDKVTAVQSATCVAPSCNHS